MTGVSPPWKVLSATAAWLVEPQGTAKSTEEKMHHSKDSRTPQRDASPDGPQQRVRPSRTFRVVKSEPVA